MSEPAKRAARRRDLTTESRKKRIKLLEAEVAELRARIGLIALYSSFETWQQIDESTRHRLAAVAFVSEWGNCVRALKRVGFKVNSFSRAERDALCVLIFDAPGARQAIDALLLDAAMDAAARVARMWDLAKYGDDLSSINAADFIFRLYPTPAASTEAPPLHPGELSVMEVLSYDPVDSTDPEDDGEA